MLLALLLLNYETFISFFIWEYENFPKLHAEQYSTQELKQLADELRSDVIFNVSKTGGHLGSSLGVVELTVALHYVFNAPKDKILWDVGHQVHFSLFLVSVFFIVAYF